MLHGAVEQARDAKEVRRPDNAVGVDDVDEDVFDVAGGTVEGRADIRAFAVELVALAAGVLEDDLAVGEGTGRLGERGPRLVDGRGQFLRRRPRSPPRFLDQLVEFAVAECLDAEDGVIGDGGAIDLLRGHGVKQRLRPFLPRREGVDYFTAEFFGVILPFG